MRFIDLFAGLGGFNLALSRLGHTCVFSSEIDSELVDLYEKNFGIRPVGDIRLVSVDDVPSHDILCAGFPCQPFSKAGDQQGFECPRWGDLFDYVLQLIEHHRPSYFLLENVPNLLRHDSGRTWIAVRNKLRHAGYHIDAERLSPHHFGIPQIRERVFVVGSRSSLSNFCWPKHKPNPTLSLRTILDSKPIEARALTPQARNCLETWQDFLDRFPATTKLPSFPIWSMEFGATYPYQSVTPYKMTVGELRQYSGSHGMLLDDLDDNEIMSNLPSYARTQQAQFPRWKIQFIRQNRELYQANQDCIKPWIPKVLKFPPSLQKFEWNCQGEQRNIWNLVIQFRASGVRVKRPTTAPSLVAMTTTQVPIIGWEERYMTPIECARLQSMESIKHLPKRSAKAFSALGNAVNVHLVELIAKALLPRSELRMFVADDVRRMDNLKLITSA